MVTKFNFKMNETDYLEIDNQESDLLFIRVKENDCVNEISIDKQHIQYLICLLQLLESKMD